MSRGHRIQALQTDLRDLRGAILLAMADGPRRMIVTLGDDQTRREPGGKLLKQRDFSIFMLCLRPGVPNCGLVHDLGQA